MHFVPPSPMVSYRSESNETSLPNKEPNMGKSCANRSLQRLRGIQIWFEASTTIDEDMDCKRSFDTHNRPGDGARISRSLYSLANPPKLLEFLSLSNGIPSSRTGFMLWIIDHKYLLQLNGFFTTVTDYSYPSWDFMSILSAWNVKPRNPQIELDCWKLTRSPWNWIEESMHTA